MNTKQLALLISIVFAHQTSFAIGFENAAVAFKSGNWKVLRTINSMTDEVNCTGIYKENYNIQLSKDALYVTVGIGIKGVTLRFNDKPALPYRLADEKEKFARTIIISGGEFSELIESDRLRLEALTLMPSIVSEDLDLKGIKDALNSIGNGCPVDSASIATLDPGKTSTSICTELLITRMKEQGLKKKQISAICKE